jgi:hypothetical protein
MRSEDFLAATKRLIAARSGYLCAFPNCFAPTVGPADDGTSINLGEAAHITAAQPNGPRYDPSMTPEERRDAENGIWMCRTHAALIDRDVERFTVDVLRDWKFYAEDRARRLIGQPLGCSAGTLATVSPAVRLGAEVAVIVEDQYIPHTYLFDATDENAKLSWFVNAFVIQFSILKKPNLKYVSMDHLLVTVHETKEIPEYQRVFMVYPAEADLFYVEIDKNAGRSPREFRPDRFFYRRTDDAPERAVYPPTLVIDDDTPAQIALRFNAKNAGMYLVSVDAEISSGQDRERLPVMPPQWIILEEPMDDYDPAFGA